MYFPSLISGTSRKILNQKPLMEVNKCINSRHRFHSKKVKIGNKINLNCYVTSHLPCCQWRMTHISFLIVYEVSCYKSQPRGCLLFPSQMLGNESILAIEFYSSFPIVQQITFSAEIHSVTLCHPALWPEVEWASPKWIVCLFLVSHISSTKHI